MSIAPRGLTDTVIRLAIAQALAGANSAVIFATGAIIGAQLASDPRYATLPVSVYVVGMALGTLPAGWVTRRCGRRIAFIAGTACGVLAGLLGALAVLTASLPLYCAATFAGGLYASVVLTFRFAAADGAAPADRPRALSWVMAGGVFAGVLGPQLVTWTMGLWPPYLFAVSYLAQSVVALVAMAVLAGVDLPRPRSAEPVAGRPLAEIARQPRFVAAVVCGVVSYTLMNLVMTSAPLAMQMCGLPLSASNWAIQWHIVAMYGPSFFTGALIVRFGAPRVVVGGLALTLASAFIGLSGQTATHYAAVLILLGLGWNLGFIGASALVLECHRPDERTRVQSLNDFLVFGTMAVGSFSSGQILAAYGWDAINLVVLPFAGLAMAALALSGLLRRRAATA